MAFALRIYRLDFQPLWWDEGYSVFFAGHPLAQLLRATAADIHPPAYYLLLRAWSSWATFGPWSVRFLSVAAGTLSAAAVYILGRRLMSGRAGRLAAALLTLSPFQIHHAQEARMYPLVTLLALLSTYCLTRALDSGPTGSPRRWWAGYTATVVVALLTHYYAVFIPVFQGIYAVVFRRGALARWLASTAAGAALCVPWLWMIAGELPRRAAGKVLAEGDPVRSLPAFLTEYLSTATIGYGTTGGPGRLAFFAAAVLITVGVAAGRRLSWLAALYLAVPLAGGLLLNQIFPFEAFPRLLAYAAPAAYLLIAAGLLQLARWRRVAFAATALALVGLTVPYPGLYSARRQPGEDYRPIISTIDGLAGSRDLVILDFPWQAGYLLSYSHSDAAWWIARGSVWAADPSQMNRDLAQLLHENSRLWYVAEAGLGGRRGQNIEGYLVDHAYPALDRWYAQSRLVLFGTDSADPVQPLDVSFGRHIRLTGIGMRESAAPGDVLPVLLHWEASATVRQPLKVFVHLLDPAGQVAAQRDAQPVAGLRPTTTWRTGEWITDRLGVLIPANLPAGQYLIEVGMYDPATDLRLPVSERGRPIGDRLLLGPVTVRN